MFGIHQLPKKHTATNTSGIYLTTLASQENAQNYLLTLLNKNKKINFISFQSIPDFFNLLTSERKKEFKSSFSKRRTYFISQEKRQLSADKFLLDIKRISFKKGDNVVLNIPDYIFLTVRSQIKTTFFQFLNQMAEKNNICFFIVSHGQESYRVNNWVMETPEYFLGLSSLHKVEHHKYIYQIQYWIADAQVSNSLDYDVILNEQDEFAVDANDNELEQLENTYTNFLYDGELIYIAQSAIDVNQTGNTHLSIFASNNELFDTINNLSQGVVILSINQQADVHHIAVQCYRLRRKYGQHFKIILREMQQCLRYSDETFLSYAGINLIIPASVRYARFLTIVESMQKQQTTCNIPSSVDELLSMESDIKYSLKGYVNNQRFVSRCQQLIDQYETSQLQFALIRLALLPGLDIQSCLSMCNIKRDGDLVTACNDAIYVLLSSVRENDIQIALKHIFKLPVADIFQNTTIYATTGRVQMQLPDILSHAFEVDIQSTQTTPQNPAEFSNETNSAEAFTFAVHKPLRF